MYFIYIQNIWTWSTVDIGTCMVHKNECLHTYKAKMFQKPHGWSAEFLHAYRLAKQSRYHSLVDHITYLTPSAPTQMATWRLSSGQYHWELMLEDFILPNLIVACDLHWNHGVMHQGWGAESPGTVEVPGLKTPRPCLWYDCHGIAISRCTAPSFARHSPLHIWLYQIRAFWSECIWTIELDRDWMKSGKSGWNRTIKPVRQARPQPQTTTHITSSC